MFCPNCGQQQIADSTKFCPRCGTQLAGLAEWLAGGATLTIRETPAPFAPAPMSPRRKGMRRGAKVMFLSGVLLPLMIGMCVAADSPGPLVIFFVMFFAGLSMMLYARLFGDDVPRAVGAKAASRRMPGATPTAPVLPPATADHRVDNFPRRGVRTAELSQPPSVTENTTRLLGDE